MNKTLTIAVALLGLGLATAAVVWLGAGKIFHAILAIGLRGLVVVLLWQLMVFVVLGFGWWCVCPGARLWNVIWGRLVREGSEICLPFSELGALVFGARALMVSGVDLTLAGASSIVDVITEGIGLAPFVLLGLVIILALKPGSSLVLPMAAGVFALAAGGAASFFLRKRLRALVDFGVRHLLQKWVRDAPDQARRMEDKIAELFRQRQRIAGAAAIHFIAWCGGGGNVYIAYRLLGAHVTIPQALAIEALLSSILSVGFLIPAGAGVQEFSYLALGHLFGVPPHLSLALSLIRRARDILIGAPALGVWQLLEARQLRQAAHHG